MPTRREYHQYDKRFVELLDKALKRPVLLHRKFRSYSEAYEFRHTLYQLRYAARDRKIKKEWDTLTFRISSLNDLMISRKEYKFDGALAEILAE